MIISHKYQFIFIKNGKTAGTSIEVFLSRLCASFDIVTPIYPTVESHFPRNYEGFYNRMTSAEIRKKIEKKIWKNYFKFCVERNPWDKAISYYYMAKSRVDGNLSFDEFLSGCEFPINFPRYTEPGNSSEIIVDKVIDFDNLVEGLGEVFRRLGLSFDGSLGVYAKSEYRTDRRPYQEVLTNSQARKIQEIFAMEIDLHGYHFQKIKLIG